MRSCSIQRYKIQRYNLTDRARSTRRQFQYGLNEEAKMSASVNWYYFRKG